MKDTKKRTRKNRVRKLIRAYVKTAVVVITAYVFSVLAFCVLHNGPLSAYDTAAITRLVEISGVTVYALFVIPLTVIAVTYAASDEL